MLTTKITRRLAVAAFAGLIGALSWIAVAAPIAQQQVQPGATTTDQEVVYVVTGARTTALYHRKDCPWLSASAPLVFTLTEAKKRYFQAHCLCVTGREGVPPCEGQPLTPTAPVVPAQTTTAPVPTPVAAIAAAPKTAQPARAAAARQQCTATTKKGARCSRMAEAGGSYCWQHK